MKTRVSLSGNRPVLSLAFAVLTFLTVQTAACAHFIWATVEKGQARFALLENIGEAPNAQFGQYVANLAPRSGDKALTLGETRDGARYAAVPAGQELVTAESVVGAKEREGKSYLLVYYAKGAVSLAAAAVATKAPAELVAHKEGKDLVVSLRRNGAAPAQGEVWVQWPGSEESSSKTDAQGDVRVPWMVAPRSGFVGLRAMVTEDRAGEVGGKPYASIHRWTTLTFPLEGAKTEPSKTNAAAEAGKPLTRILREAYGGNHEAAGNAAFNQTLFAGQLTRAQLVMHLQQRALIHKEADRLLSAAQGGSVPYGAAQKEVLTLLSGDLTALGAGWPTEAQALPLTRAFLQKMRDSEKQGPYFALGVFHVYYGGVTNGGRMIGKQIGETLQFLPAYYEKSDGYRAYLKEVDKITDPAAQQEMVRGGQEAYKYIIAFSNDDIFKAKIAKK